MTKNGEAVSQEFVENSTGVPPAEEQPAKKLLVFTFNMEKKSDPVKGIYMHQEYFANGVKLNFHVEQFPLGAPIRGCTLVLGRTIDGCSNRFQFDSPLDVLLILGTFLDLDDAEMAVMHICFMTTFFQVIDGFQQS